MEPWDSLYNELRRREQLLRALNADQFLRPSLADRLGDEYRAELQRRQALLGPEWISEQFGLAVAPFAAASGALAAAARLERERAEDVTTQLQRRMAERQSEYDRLFGSTIALGRVYRELEEARSRWTMESQLQQYLEHTRSFAQQTEALYASLGSQPAVVASMNRLLFEWPLSASFDQTQVLAVASGVEVAESGEAGQEFFLQRSEPLEERLAAVGSQFVIPYRGAVAALHSANPDACRHVATSLRELLSHLLDTLAPKAVLESHFANPGEHKENGQFTRRAQLIYVFRAVGIGEYARMTDNHVDYVLSIFYPTNRGVHSLSPPFTPEQLRVLRRAAEGGISIVLEAGGY